MVLDLATDPYVPTVGSLPADASPEEGLDWITRQQGRLAEEVGFSFCIADLVTDEAVGAIGLWTAGLAEGRATAGYAVAPPSRGQGFARDALLALTAFGWSLPALHRVELYIEPANLASARTANEAGYQHEGLLRSHQWIADRRCDMHLFAAIRPHTESS
jgi:RimJ/RimL family protein N-acetyltransferase